MPHIFINYRRGDTSTNASRLCEWLSERYGEDQVFMDVDTLVPGRPWREAIERAVGSSDLVLALIGTDWLTELQRRKDVEDDFMRHELETALRRDISIIPVLVDGAKMPRSDELPDSLTMLSEYQAFEVRNERFRFDKQELLKTVDRALGIERKGITPEREGMAPEASVLPPPLTPSDALAPRRPGEPESAVAGPVESELNKWNWGAFLLGPIWGIGHGVFRSLLTLVPIYGIYEWIMLGRKGNRWAWEARQWDTVESFRATQRKWAMWGIIVDVVFFFILSASSGG
jgi:hypothetical protein